MSIYDTYIHSSPAFRVLYFAISQIPRISRSIKIYRSDSSMDKSIKIFRGALLILESYRMIFTLLLSSGVVAVAGAGGEGWRRNSGLETTAGD
jgi:hypothetical protein